MKNAGKPCHVFVDESKRKGYLVAAAVVATGDLSARRRDLRELVLPGQRRIHMKSESDPRRRLILKRMAEWGLSAILIEAGPHHGNDLARRAAALEALMAFIANEGHTRLCLESDETQDKRDRQQLHALCRQLPVADSFEYHHLRAHEEPLLTVPDAIAWSWTRGGPWRELATPLVDQVIPV